MRTDPVEALRKARRALEARAVDMVTWTCLEVDEEDDDDNDVIIGSLC